MSSAAAMNDLLLGGRCSICDSERVSRRGGRKNAIFSRGGSKYLRLRRSFVLWSDASRVQLFIRIALEDDEKTQEKDAGIRMDTDIIPGLWWLPRIRDELLLFLPFA